MAHPSPAFGVISPEPNSPTRPGQLRTVRASCGLEFRCFLTAEHIKASRQRSSPLAEARPNRAASGRVGTRRRLREPKEQIRHAGENRRWLRVKNSQGRVKYRIAMNNARDHFSTRAQLPGDVRSAAAALRPNQGGYTTVTVQRARSYGYSLHVTAALQLPMA